MPHAKGRRAAKKGGKKKGGGYVSKAKKSIGKSIKKYGPTIGKAALALGSVALANRMGRRAGIAMGKPIADDWVLVDPMGSGMVRRRKGRGRGYSDLHPYHAAHNVMGSGYSDLHPYHAGGRHGGSMWDDLAKGFETGAKIAGSVLPLVL